MRLLSIFQRKTDEKARSAPAPVDLDAVQEARIRARRRLIGASVLVVIGVIGFPLLFETQPRPIPVDIPIDIPRKESAPPLVMPSARPSRPPATASAEPPASSVSLDTAKVASSTAGEAQKPEPVLPKAAASVAEARPAEPKMKPPAQLPPVSSEAVRPAAAPAAPLPDASAVRASETRRAQALLEGKEATAHDAGRFVVQVGAFADAAAAREARLRIEKLGLKTYTQVAQTAQGSRIRVRVGPFAEREAAQRAQEKIKAAGSPAVVLTL